MQFQTLKASDPSFPVQLALRLDKSAPAVLTYFGNVGLLLQKKTALFCSGHCPGSVILRAYDQVAQWRDAGRCVISGFHSPIEKECLRILLRGSPPIIICPARALLKRTPADWQKPLDDGRLLILSAFREAETRVTNDLARRRNEIVAALADEAWFAHITPGGKNDLLTLRLAHWGTPFSTVETT